MVPLAAPAPRPSILLDPIRVKRPYMAARGPQADSKRWCVASDRAQRAHQPFQRGSGAWVTIGRWQWTHTSELVCRRSPVAVLVLVVAISQA
jgi:hypothetical protein